MSNAKIGIQLMIFREQIKTDGPYEVLKKLSEIGYNCVEISQVDMTAENVAEIKRACEDFNLEIAAMSASLEPMAPGMEALSTDYDKIVADCKTLNCNYLRIGILPFHYMSSYDLSMDFVKKVEEMAVKLDAEHGIKLYYHNHHNEFIKYDGKYFLDIIRDNTEKLGFEIDVHWVQRGGENPAEYIKGFKGRLELLHLKDYAITTPDFEGVDRTNIMAFFERFNNIIRFAPVGEGSLNFPEIIKSGLETGAKFLIVEQDDTYGVDPYEVVKISRDNLKKMGY